MREMTSVRKIQTHDAVMDVAESGVCVEIGRRTRKGYTNKSVSTPQAKLRELLTLYVDTPFCVLQAKGLKSSLLTQ